MVVAALRQDVGILLIGGARTVRDYLANCFTCKLLCKTRAQQLMAPLPQYRVKPRQPVFSSISINYAGPYEVKRARSLEKRWLCIFVCNLTSAVRVEVVESLETTAFLNALRRFLCITGNKLVTFEQTVLLRSLELETNSIEHNSDGEKIGIFSGCAKLLEKMQH